MLVCPEESRTLGKDVLFFQEAYKAVTGAWGDNVAQKEQVEEDACSARAGGVGSGVSTRQAHVEDYGCALDKHHRKQQYSPCVPSTAARKMGPGLRSSRKVIRCMRSFSASSSRV